MYKEYEIELNSQVDEEAEEEAKRRALAKCVVPLSPEQEAADSALLQNANNRKAAEREARRAGMSSFRVFLLISFS